MLDMENVDEVIEEEIEEVEEIDSVDSESVDLEDETGTTEEDTSADTIEIDGEAYTLEELREFKQGHLRQSDYTKKTQELARMREELQDAANLKNYLEQNPHVIDALSQVDVDPYIAEQARQFDPVVQRLNQLEMQLAEKEVQSELDRLSAKYDDFNDVAVLEKAMELNISDLEFVYKGMREVANQEEIMAQAVEKAKEQLAAEIKKNKGATRTVVDNSSTDVNKTQNELTPREVQVAINMGIDPEEYAKWK